MAPAEEDQAEISEIDLKGISSIERFLDSIEDVDKEAINKCQEEFEEIFRKHELSPGSPDYIDNKSRQGGHSSEKQKQNDYCSKNSLLS